MALPRGGSGNGTPTHGVTDQQRSHQNNIVTLTGADTAHSRDSPPPTQAANLVFTVTVNGGGNSQDFDNRHHYRKRPRQVPLWLWRRAIPADRKRRSRESGSTGEWL